MRFFLLLTAALLTLGVRSGDRAIAQYEIPSPPFWNGIFRSEPPIPPSEGGGRGEVCLIAPMATSDAIARVGSVQPIFIWQGQVGRIEVKQQGQEGVLWQQEDDLSGAVTYDGETLTPETVYNWLVYLPYADQPAFEIPFVIVSSDQQAEIAQDLQEIDQQSEAASLEEQAIQRADYFASQGLWSDFWREILSVEAPSEALDNAIDETVTRLCD